MKTGRYQRGEGMWTVVFILLLIGFLAFTTLKVLPVYMEDFNIASAVEGVESDQTAEYNSPLSVRQKILKRLHVNNVKILGSDDVSVTRDGGFFNVVIDYEVVVPYIGNVSLLMEFQHTAQVRINI